MLRLRSWTMVQAGHCLARVTLMSSDTEDLHGSGPCHPLSTTPIELSSSTRIFLGLVPVQRGLFHHALTPLAARVTVLDRLLVPCICQKPSASLSQQLVPPSLTPKLNQPDQPCSHRVIASQLSINSSLSSVVCSPWTLGARQLERVPCHDLHVALYSVQDTQT